MSTEESNKLLKQQLEFTNKQLEISQQQNKELLFKIDKIQAQLDKLLRQMYGRKSEKSPKPNKEER